MKELSGLLLMFCTPCWGAVAWVQTIPAWSINGATTVTSGSFTPTAGDAIIVVGAGQAASLTIGVTGTGTYNILTPPGQYSASSWTEALASNLSAASGSQTVTVAGQTAGKNFGWAWEYSGGANALVGAAVSRATPGTGAGAILGTSVTVPSGAILLALCVDTQYNSGSTETITSPSGTNRGSGSAQTYAWAATEYSGTGGAIQPSFTGSLGAADTYNVIQVIVSVGAAPTFNPGFGFWATNYDYSILDSSIDTQ